MSRILLPRFLRKLIMKKLLALAFACFSAGFTNLAAADSEDAMFDKVAEEYIQGYLSARPLQATRLGFHQYDGKINDYSRLAIDAEIARLQRFADRLQKFDATKLGPRASIDLRILLAAIRGDLFNIQDMAAYERNPMTYVTGFDVNIYIKRNFAPLEDRVRSIIAIESQVPNIMLAGKTNLLPSLPKPFIELAIEIAKGSADFLRKDLVEALKGLKDVQLSAQFRQSNRKAASALQDYADWLTKEKLPNATPDFALGDEKYQRLLAEYRAGRSSASKNP